MSTPCSHVKQSVYALRYSQQTVEAFVQKYSRATNFLALLLDIAPIDYVNHLIKLFMYRNNRWNVVRDCIKWIDKYDRISKLSKMPKQYALEYLKAVKYMAEDYRIFENKDISLVDNADS